MDPSHGVCLLSKQILFVGSLHEKFPPKATNTSNRSSLGTFYREQWRLADSCRASCLTSGFIRSWRMSLGGLFASTKPWDAFCFSMWVIFDLKDGAQRLHICGCRVLSLRTWKHIDQKREWDYRIGYYGSNVMWKAVGGQKKFRSFRSSFIPNFLFIKTGFGDDTTYVCFWMSLRDDKSLLTYTHSNFLRLVWVKHERCLLLTRHARR